MLGTVIRNKQIDHFRLYLLMDIKYELYSLKNESLQLIQH